MAFNEFLADRVRQRLHGHEIVEKKMMGGLIFMVNGKMCVGVDQDRQTKDDRLMIRLGKEVYEEVLKQPGCRKMDFTGREMKGFVFVYADGFDKDDDLDFWVGKALTFNSILK